MEKQNVDNYWSSDCQCQWNGSSKEKQHSCDQLQSKNKQQVVRRKHDREILAGHLGRRRWLRDKVQKTVQTEDDENEREQISRDGGSDLHKALLLGLRSLGNDTGAPRIQGDYTGKFTRAHAEKLVGCRPAILFASAIRSCESEPK